LVDLDSACLDRADHSGCVVEQASILGTRAFSLAVCLGLLQALVVLMLRRVYASTARREASQLAASQPTAAVADERNRREAAEQRIKELEDSAHAASELADRKARRNSAIGAMVSYYNEAVTTREDPTEALKALAALSVDFWQQFASVDEKADDGQLHRACTVIAATAADPALARVASLHGAISDIARLGGVGRHVHPPEPWALRGAPRSLIGYTQDGIALQPRGAMSGGGESSVTLWIVATGEAILPQPLNLLLLFSDEVRHVEVVKILGDDGHSLPRYSQPRFRRDFGRKDVDIELRTRS
jgi:hypothetical protein